jgi:pimeloyl-ACP methyl ester carboxylesterase
VATTAYGVHQGTLTVNDVRFSYLGAGDEGPLALCLHGFPDSPYSWTSILVQLAEAGYRAIAPFQRGYAPTEVPRDGRYQTAMLALDAIGFHEELGGGEPAVLIGHDWGAPSAYGAANIAPERWSKVVGLAAPPGGAFMQALTTRRSQLKRSWYMFFFQHPLADQIVMADDLSFIDMLWSDWSPGLVAPEELARAKECLRRPENLAVALGYYRVTFGTTPSDPALADAQSKIRNLPAQPVLCLHGADDGCFGAEVFELARETITSNITIDTVEGCGHFLQLEKPHEVGERILRFVL